MTIYKSIFGYFKKHPFSFILMIIIILSVTLLSLLPPQLLRIIVDDVLTNKKQELLIKYAIFYLSAFGLICIFDFLKEVYFNIVSQGICKKVRLDMLTHINKMDYNSFTKFNSGNLEAYFSNDVESINQLITSGAISLVIDLLKVFGIIASIFFYNVVFGGITVFIVILIIIFVLFIKKKMFKAQLKNKMLEGQVNNIVMENVNNIKTVKSFRIYNYILKKYKKILLKHYDSNQSSNFYDSVFPCMMMMLKSLFIATIIILASYKMSWFGLTVGMMISVVDLLTNLFSPIEALGNELQTIQKSMAGIERLNEFFKIEGSNCEFTSIDFKENDSLLLKFEDVCYSYDGENVVIENFNLELKGSDKITLKGKSGSGKSTLFKLAYGTLKPSSGRITINGVDTFSISPSDRSKIFGIVYQDYFFSGGSIYEEITLKNKNISKDEVIEALKMVGLNRVKDIDKPLIPTNYSTGELSMFNIARVIVLDSKILFLDEMNAKIDNVSADKIMRIINKIGKDKIVLSINHFGSLLKNSEIIDIDKIYK